MKTKFIPHIIIAALLLFIFFTRSCNGGKYTAPKADTVTTVDTFWNTHDSVIYVAQPQPKRTIYPDTIPAEYVADTNCSTLEWQYNDLVKEYLAKNIYRDTFRHDSSYVALTDTVSGNYIKGRAVQFHMTYPVIERTTTITKTLPKTRQVYFGGGIAGNEIHPINRVELGVVYKDRKDRMFGINADKNLQNGQMSYGVRSYWLLSFRQKP